eukprot:5862541-Pyramimonas_sp.AAC.1
MRNGINDQTRVGQGYSYTDHMYIGIERVRWQWNSEPPTGKSASVLNSRRACKGVLRSRARGLNSPLAKAPLGKKTPHPT